MNERRRILEPGTTLNKRYNIIEKIGSGGFAITYKAEDTFNNIPVAIKEFFPADSSLEWEHEKARFVKEAKILREFDYLEGIVSVRDVFENEDTAYLVMDYIEGISLKEYVREYGTFSWDELLSMLSPVMKSLAKIHRRNVIHYDISPDNLMIGMDNRVWLIDFGASNKCASKVDRTVILKQGYAPLEQYYSDGSTFDGKTGPWTDIYALSATMYTALTGEKPGSAVERMQGNDVRWEIFDSLTEDWQKDALKKGMSLNKSERYASMEEFIEALTYSPSDSDMTVIKAGMKDSGAQRESGNKKYIIIYILLLVIAMMAGAILYGMLDRRLSDDNAKESGMNSHSVEPSETGNNTQFEGGITPEKDTQEQDVTTEKTTREQGATTEKTTQEQVVTTEKITQEQIVTTEEKNINEPVGDRDKNKTDNQSNSKSGIFENNKEVLDDDDELY